MRDHWALARPPNRHHADGEAHDPKAPRHLPAPRSLPGSEHDRIPFDGMRRRNQPSQPGFDVSFLGC
jgi:hypothetical protein